MGNDKIIKGFKDVKNNYIKKTVSERFHEKIITSKETGCWLWKGSLNNKGYGWININRKATLAHRVSWILKNGEIPPNMKVLHKCDIRNCVNPDHLFLGTLKDNMQDCSDKGRLSINWPRYKGEQHKMSKLTESAVKEIRASRNINGYGDLLANKYGVNRQTIYDIARGKYWNHVPVEVTNG